MRSLVLATLLATGFAAAALAQDSLHKTFQAPLGGRKSAVLRAELGAAALTLDSEAPAGSLYRVEVDHDPEISPIVKLDRDTLRLATKDERRLRRGGRNDWAIHLGRSVVWTLDLGLGASRGTLDLSGLGVRELDVEAGAAQLEIGWKRPGRVPLERATVQGGAARIALRGLGYSGVRDLSVEGGAGTFDLDFSGPLKGRARVRIQAGVGAIHVDIPKAIGIRVVDRDITMAKVDWPSDLGSGDEPETPNYATARGRIDLDVKAALGKVRIRRI